MSSKYSGLPDIDSAPDVFETPDEPEYTQRRDDDNGEDNRKAALTTSSSEIDSGGLPPRRRAGGRFTNAQADSLPSSQPAETPVARLRRLQAEVAQLEAEMKAAPPASEPAAASSATVPKRRSVIPARQRVDVVTELSVLREKLSVLSGDAGGAGAGSQIGGVDWQARLARLELSPDSEAAGPTSRPSHAVPVASAGEVDKRLAALEQQVGVAEEGDAPSSLVDLLNRMDHVLNVLTQPRHLDSISRRVKLLVVELERASSTSRRAGSAPTSAGSTTGGSGISAAEQEALQALFGLLPRLDPLIPIIPPLLARLRSLSTLHAEALGIAADLRELQSADRSVSEEERELSSIVKGVQHGVTEALASIQNNWEATQGRIQALDKRVAALGK